MAMSFYSFCAPKSCDSLKMPFSHGFCVDVLQYFSFEEKLRFVHQKFKKPGWVPVTVAIVHLQYKCQLARDCISLVQCRVYFADVTTHTLVERHRPVVMVLLIWRESPYLSRRWWLTRSRCGWAAPYQICWLVWTNRLMLLTGLDGVRVLAQSLVHCAVIYHILICLRGVTSASNELALRSRAKIRTVILFLAFICYHPNTAMQSISAFASSCCVMLLI